MAVIGEASVKVVGDLKPLLAAFDKAQKATVAFDKKMSAASAKTNRFFKALDGKKLRIDSTAITSMNRRLDATQRRLEKLGKTTVAPKVKIPQIKIPKIDAGLGSNAGVGVDNLNNKVKGLNNTVSTFGLTAGRVFGTIGTYLGAKEVMKYADSWTQMGNELAAASQISGMQARSLKDLNMLANESRSGIQATTSLYARLMRSTVGVAESEEQIAKATDAVNKAFKAGGAATSEQAAGIMQLGQALGSGFLQGDELRSIRENAPLVAQAIADEFGTTIAGLKELGSEGKLTSERVFQALLNSHAKISKTFATTNSTIADGFTKLNNAMTEYIGGADKTNGATTNLVKLLGWLSDNFATAADAAMKFVAVIAGAMIGRSLANMVTSLGLAAVNLNKFVTSLRVASATATASAASFSSLGLALGPIGALIAGLASVAAYSYVTSANEASAKTDEWREELFKLGLISEETAGKIDTIAKSLDNVSEADRLRAITAIRQELEKIEGELLDIYKKAQVSTGISGLFMSDVDKSAYKTIMDMVTGLRDGKLNAEEVEKELAKISELKVSQPVIDLAKELSKALDMQDGFINRQAQLGSNPYMDELNADLDKWVMNLERSGHLLPFTDEQKNSLLDAIKLYSETGQGAEELQKLVANLGAEYPNMNGWFAGLNDFIGRVAQAWAQVANLKGAMNGLSPSANIRGTDPHEGRYKEQDSVNEYIASQKQVSSLSQAELKLRQGIAAELKAAEKAGVNISKEQAKQLALDKQAQQERFAADRKAEKASSGGGKSKSKGGSSKEKLGDFGKEKRSIEERIALLKAEQEILTTLDPLIEDYGFALAQAETAQRLMSDAKRDGLAVAKEELSLQQLLKGDFNHLSGAAREQAQSILTLATSYGEAVAKSKELNVANDELKNNFNTLREAERSAMSGFVSDMVKGKSAAEALSNALGKLADAFLEIGLNLLFGSKGSSGFGAIGGLFGFADGGYTGDGGKYEPAGTVHKGEYVFSKKATQKLGVSNLEEIHNQAKKGFAEGGLVGRQVSVPNSSLSRQSGSLNSSSQKVNVAVDVKTSVDENGNLESFVRNVSYDVSSEVTTDGISRYNNAMPDRVQAIQKNPRRRARQ